jgi:ABC-type transporter Mla subunit MlaD
MIRATSAALFIFLVSLTGVVLWLGYDAHKLLTGLDLKLNGASGVLMRVEGVESKANATLVNLDKGTAAWAASAKDQAAAITDLATDTHGTLSEVNSTVESLHGSADSLHTELDSLHKTTDQATALAAALTSDAETANTTIAAAQPVLAGFARDSEDLDALLKDQAIHQTLTAAAATLDNASGILADGRKVADKAAADFLKPVPWYEKPVKYFGDLWDISAAVARHTP